MKVKNTFEEYKDQLSADELELLSSFFSEFDAHVILPKKERVRMRKDFQNAILYYSNTGIALQTALSRLDLKNLGGFYARPAISWYPLDDAAKIYPLSMEHGRMSVFRMSAYLKAAVVPELLQIALSFTIKRFPSFATTLKKGFFWHYLDASKRRYAAEMEILTPCQPISVSQSGSPAFRVMYFKKRISVEFFHVLTDGTGGMTFLKCLVAEYLRLIGIEAEDKSCVWDINQSPHTSEVANEFANVKRPKASTSFADKEAVQLGGKLTRHKPHRVLHFKLRSDELKAAAQRNGCTITAYMLALMFVAGKFATDELSGDMSIQVPINMRKFYPSKTVRNFSMYCGVRMPICDITDISSIVKTVSEQLTEKAARESVSKMLTSTERLVNSLVWVPLVIKLPAARLIYGFMGDNSFTTTLSNMGIVEMPKELSEHIESMDFILGTAINNRAGCGMVTFKNTTTLSVAKNTVDPSFEEKLYELLCAEGLSVEVEGSERYED